MSGTRWEQLVARRVGVLVPSSNAVVEPDAAVLPEGISAHFARLPITRDDPTQLAALLDAAPDAARLLAHAGVGAIAFACTSGSLHGGVGYDVEVVARIEAATGVPATTTATALVHALAELGAARVGLVSPYEPWLEDRVVEFLGGHGIAVAARRSVPLPDPRESSALPPAEIAELVRSLPVAELDAVVISCTAFQGVAAARLLEGDLDPLPVPVLTSNQATYHRLVALAGSTA